MHAALADMDTEHEAPAAEKDPAAEPKKRRKKKKRRRKRPATSKPPAKAQPAKNWGKGLWPTLLVVGLFELWLFGRRGHLEVCVAKDGAHDFALLSEKRTDENTRRYPTCESRYNLGVVSAYDDAREEALLRACHRANILKGKDARAATLICAIEEDGWKHRVTEAQCPPWHDHYYKRMLWFLY